MYISCFGLFVMAPLGEKFKCYQQLISLGWDIKGYNLK